MAKLCIAVSAAIMLFWFIKDSSTSKKIWIMVTAAASAAAMIYIVSVYYSFGQKLQKISYEYLDKAKWQSDFNTYILSVVVLLLVVVTVFVYAYNNIEKHKFDENPDSFAEYIVIGAALIIAMVVYFIGTSFALTHMSKYFDVSFYPTAISSAAVGTIIINILLYMKILQ